MAGKPHHSNGVSLRRRFLSGSSWALSGKILSAGATLLGNALLARLLTQEQLGNYFLAFSVVSLISIFCIWGLNRGLVKLIASELAKGQQALARNGIISAFTLVLITSTIAASTLVSPVGDWLFTTALDSPLLTPLTLFLALWILVKTLQGLVSEAFRGFHDIRLATIFGGLVTAVLSTLLYLLIWLHQGQASLDQIIQLTVLATASALAVGLFLLHRRAQELDRDGKPSLQQVYRFGLPLMVTSIFLFGVREFHLWLLAAFQPKGEVALYGSALRLINILVLPLTVINAVIPPMVADLYSREDRAGLQSLLQKTATLMSIPAFAVFGLILLLGAEILALVYGEPYRAASMPFLILAAGQFLNVLAGSPGVLLTMSGHERVVMASALGAGGIGLTVSFFASQSYGAMGAAAGYSTGIVLVNIIMWRYAYGRLSVRTHGSGLVAVRMLKGLLTRNRSG
ncbi:lipopolysaccharide biosynthesis protein [Thiohalobacter thiocyanaticus]|uniref:Polysaccharide biosynthesis protein C-terminal domain-containing protein n=1 Tax=Thiohalobacter thiocyanaticus TaxID=585455 RepID=A0A426QIR8_9GAMM|nr:oligosaccharide flippase family protein [Thiohalobacter thiocyanaticus]RRQ21645.1 hypothetical protein D6C00_06580 [Thiohalobacter thiocyanaticus]